MKRSEMLKIIEEVISPCNSTYRSHREKAAERVLEAIENAGMLPPSGPIMVEYNSPDMLKGIRAVFASRKWTSESTD